LLLPTALNHWFPKPIPVAVVALKEPGTLRLEEGPKIMPAGFIKNRFELPPVT